MFFEQLDLHGVMGHHYSISTGSLENRTTSPMVRCHSEKTAWKLLCSLANGMMNFVM